MRLSRCSPHLIASRSRDDDDDRCGGHDIKNDRGFDRGDGGRGRRGDIPRASGTFGPRAQRTQIADEARVLQKEDRYEHKKKLDVNRQSWRPPTPPPANEVDPPNEDEARVLQKEDMYEHKKKRDVNSQSWRPPTPPPARAKPLRAAPPPFPPPSHLAGEGGAAEKGGAKLQRRGGWFDKAQRLCELLLAGQSEEATSVAREFFCKKSGAGD